MLPVSLADDITRMQEEDMAWRERQRAKAGDYTSDHCPNCKRQRVMRGDDNLRRCEKCGWCIESNDYDHDFVDFLK